MDKIIRVSFNKNEGLEHFYYKSMGVALSHAILYPNSLHSITWVNVN